MLDEDAQLVLGAGVADEMASGITERGVRLTDLLLQCVELDQRNARLYLEINQCLRVFAHAGGEIGQGGPFLAHKAQYLQSTQNPIPRGSVV